MDEICPALNKVRHDTEGRARRSLRSLKKKKRYDGTVFKCNSCFGWHVGKNKPPADILQLDHEHVAAACIGWLATPAGQLHQTGNACGLELRLRLETAFLAGMDAALELVNRSPKRTDRKHAIINPQPRAD